MKWYYSVQGGHTHVRVFLNGAKCGDLCFRNEEFGELLRAASHEPLFEAIPDQANEEAMRAEILKQTI